MKQAWCARGDAAGVAAALAVVKDELACEVMFVFQLGMQSIIARYGNVAATPVVLTAGQFQSGVRFNIPDEAKLMGARHIVRNAYVRSCGARRRDRAFPAHRRKRRPYWRPKRRAAGGEPRQVALGHLGQYAQCAAT